MARNAKEKKQDRENATAARLNNAKSLGEKQFSSSLAVVPMLVAGGYEDFNSSFDRVVYENE